MSHLDRCTIWAFHPAGSTPAVWAPVRRELPDQDWEAVDLNEVAASLPTAAPYPRLIDELIHRAPPGPLLITGAGFGARLGLSVAARFEDRVRGVYLITPTPAVEDDAYLAKLAGLRRLLQDGFSEEQVKTLVPVMLYRWGPRFAQAAEELAEILREGLSSRGRALGHFCLKLDEQPSNWLHQIRAPIEAIYGAADPLFDPAEAEAWRGLGFRSVEVLPHVANQPPLEIPERVAAGLRRLMGT